MRAERFGSYSMEKTLAGTPNLLRLKSIRRYMRFTPPPRCREVMWPMLLRPPVDLSGRSSDFSGFERVISSKVETDIPRRPGDVGLYVRIGMILILPPLSSPCPVLVRSLRLERGNALAVGQRDNRLLPGSRLFAHDPLAGAHRARLARHRDGVDVDHLHAREHRLD